MGWPARECELINRAKIDAPGLREQEPIPNFVIRREQARRQQSRRRDAQPLQPRLFE
jgi:hypothetical protein